MATLNASMTFTSDDISSDQLDFTVTKALTTTNPTITSAKTSVTTVGANNIIQPRTDGQTYYVYVKHMGIDASGATVTSTLNVELTGDVVIGKLAAGEFMFMPVGGHSLGVQLQSSASTIIAEYAYFTKG
jgi:hypothetical protein